MAPRTLLTTLNAKYIHPNLAIRLLYHQNKDLGGLAYEEFTIKEDRDAIAAHCRQFEVVAFSCYIWNITQTLDVARRIKALDPNVKILLGGPEVSYDWEDVIVRPEVDYLIVGEGEIPFRAFLIGFPDLSAVPGLVRKAGEEIVVTPTPGIFDLGEYRYMMPYADDPVESLATKVLYVETSRGCPYKCEFCLASLDNKVRYLPMENIKANLLHMMQHGKVIKFLDRTFNVKRDFTLEIFRFILEHYRPGNVFQFEITADILHPDLIRFIQESVPKGLFRFEIGIQTVNQKANLEVSRKQNFDKTKQVIEALRHKVEMHLDLIVGLALDRWEDIQYSIEQVFALHPPELQLGFLKFLKGTPVRHKYEQHGFVFDPEPPYQIIESNYLSRDQLHQIELVEHALEIYWNKKRAPHTLRYAEGKYGIFEFLRGLGILFSERRPFHQYTLHDAYNILAEYIGTRYPNDPILRQMLTLDFCLQFKTRPKPTFMEELPPPEKEALLRAQGLNPQKLRYLALPLDFNYARFEAENHLDATPSTVVLEYSGTQQPRLLVDLRFTTI